MPKNYTLFWFRRDLRLNDNAALFQALNSGNEVIPLFIFDTDILEKLESRSDSRVQFIYDSISSIQDQLCKSGSSFLIQHGKPIEVISSIINEFAINQVIAGTDYEPYSLRRDKEVKEMLNEKAIPFTTFTDHILFKPGEVMKPDGTPYSIFTPFSRKWKERLSINGIPYYNSDSLIQNFAMLDFPFPKLESIGFTKTQIQIAPAVLDPKRLENYATIRDLPALNATSHNGIHLRFGTMSPRMLISIFQHNESFLNELIWREFFIHILFHYPKAASSSFHNKYDGMPWLNDEKAFSRWCEGTTGYPMVDAGMRELNATGFMHNRVRMVVASFLTKHLLSDWRWGEAYFAAKLLDYELAANNGNWQWAAGTGCDAAPYFRVFNSAEQQKKFDPDFMYCKRWIPELLTSNYPKPIVDHDFARKRAIETYKKHLSGMN
jgi:deoxyribodipyrimidine photo-lyase